MSKSNVFQQSAGELRNLRSLTLAAFLAAIFAVSYSPLAGNLMIIPGVIEIRFGFLAIAVCAMLFGPVMGGICAVIGDIVGTILFYGGAFFWGYTLSWLIMGVVFGMIFYREKISTPRIIIAMLFNTCIINLLLTTYWETLMGFGVFQALFIKRLPHNVVMLPVNIILTILVLRGVCAIYRRLQTASS